MGRRALLLLLGNQIEHISRLGDMRQVNLGLDLIRFARGTRRTAGRARLIRRPEVSPQFLRFVILHGTGMRLLLGDPNFGQHIEDRLALDLEFSGQIVDSNLTHPPFPGTHLLPKSS